ncbi:type II toxin-antitoxin system RelE/ParE family toxin [Desulfobacter curvatus]|uniref:type II toxin-antitoxin system RelE/ParE family toxin n=1 Tax=Desulfobacter curvatus TaxID=2290 RepID=UPI00035EC002|nr:type II toxin-antitoxin system RelE/ParE family toxin [Desulfobacter curvatus]
MKKLCTKWFKKWAKKMGLENHQLIEVVENLERGLSAANLGGSLFKVRVNRDGQGKSSGFRTIIAYKAKDKTIFLYGFAKNERANIDKAELHYFKILGSDLITMDACQIEKLIAENVLFDLEE